MKIKVKKSVLKESIQNQISYIMENKATPLMSATFKLLEMYETCTVEQKKSLNEVFSLLEKELYLEEKEISSIVEYCMDEDKLSEKEKKEEKECEICKSKECKCKVNLKDNKDK